MSLTAEGTATISGGTFTGSRYAVSDNADGRQCYGPSSGSFYTSGTVTITGGTFSMDPSAYLASNYEIAKTVDDMYKVIASGTATAKIGEIKYVTLADAVTAANVNDAITMLTDETLTASVTIDKSKSITLDLNGKKISTATGFNGLAAITNYGTLTVGGNGSITSSKYGIDNAGGTLTLNACTITSTTSGYYAVFNSWKELNGTYHGGTTIVNNSATLKQTNDESKGGIYAEAGNVYIHGGTVGRINAGKYTSSGTNTTLTGTVSIDGGAMKGYLYSKDGGTIIVSGGVFSKKISGWTGNNTTFNATIATNYSIVSLDNATYPYGVVTTPTVSVSGATTKTYDGAGVTLTATATPSVEKMTANGTEYTIKYNYQWSKSGSDNTYTNIEDATSSTYTTDANVADSGTYRFTVTSATGDAALNVYADATVTINPAAVTVTAKDQSIYVNGTIPDLSAPALDTHYTVTGLLNGDTLTTTPTLAYQQGGSSATPDTATAGTYDIVASGASAGDNYTITYTNGTLTISNKNKQTITAKNVTATYGDTDKSVSASVTDPTEGGGAISYAVKDGSGDYINVEATTGALTINKAGIATVVVTAAETDTYEQATKEVTVTIAKADITPTVSISDWTYGTAANDPNVTGNTGDGTVTYSYKVKDAEESTYSETVPTTVGDYTVKASIAATDNYMSGEATADFTIVKANAIVTAPTAKTLTYNGQEQELVTAGEATGGTIQYALGENAETVPTTGWNTSIPPAIDAGT